MIYYHDKYASLSGNFRRFSRGRAETIHIYFSYTKNIPKVLSFPSLAVISKIVFRTGVVEEALFKMMAKTKCQIAASVDDTSAEDLGVMRRSKIWKASANSYTWTFSVDSSNAPKPPPDAPPSPTRKERKTENIMISTVHMRVVVSTKFPCTGSLYQE